MVTFRHDPISSRRHVTVRLEAVYSLCLAPSAKRQLDPVALLQRAYPDEPAHTTQDFAEIRRLADWERTAYPAVWDEAAIEGLLESLHEINCHSLAGVVSDTIDGEGV